MYALDALIRAGKVLYAGVSDHPAWVVAQANTLATLKHWTPFVALQIEYSLIQRTPERELLPMAKGFGLTITPWSVLGAGLLTGRFTTSLEQNPELSEQLHLLAERRNEKKYGSRELSIAEAVKAMAAETGRSAAQISLNWVRQKGTIPIIGVSKMAQLKESLDALRWALTEEEMHALDRISEVELGFPHDFLMSRNVKKAFWGNTFDQVDRVRPSAYVDPHRLAQ